MYHVSSFWCPFTTVIDLILLCREAFKSLKKSRAAWITCQFKNYMSVQDSNLYYVINSIWSPENKNLVKTFCNWHGFVNFTWNWSQLLSLNVRFQSTSILLDVEQLLQYNQAIGIINFVSTIIARQIQEWLHEHQ